MLQIQINIDIVLLWLGVGTKLANHGYAVFGIDYEGHGRSMGSRCYIKRFDNIVNDCSDFFKSVCGKIPNTCLTSCHSDKSSVSDMLMRKRTSLE